MLIDLEELAGEIASKVDGAGLTPVIEKEIVHYEIIRSLGRNGLLQDITFQGGTSLRLCYGSQRYSEDLDLDFIPFIPNIGMSNIWASITRG